jgi:hypothetical protein
MRVKAKWWAYCGLIAGAGAAIYAAQAAFVMGVGKPGSLLTDPFWWTIVGCFVFLRIFPWLIDRVTPAPRTTEAEEPPASAETSASAPTPPRCS